MVEVFTMNLTEYPEKFNLKVWESLSIKEFNANDNTIGMRLTHLDDYSEGLCITKHQGMVFDDYSRHTTRVFTPRYKPSDVHPNDPSYFLSIPLLVNMVHITNGFAMVSSDH